MFTSSMESEKKVHEGGHHSRFEPSTLQEINASPYAKRCFENNGCLIFCERIMEVGFHAQLTSLVATIFSRDKAIVTDIEFTLSAYSITSTKTIPNEVEF